MKTYGGVHVWIHIFLTLSLAGSELSASRPCRFTPEERAPGTHWIGGWGGGGRAGQDDVEKRKFVTLPGLELQPLCRPARRQSLYCLRYPGSSTDALHISSLIWCWTTLFLKYSRCPAWNGLPQVLNSL
jgi:hypothetical protein